MTVTIRLPFPPSVNSLFAGKRRRYVSPRYKRWRTAAGWELISQKPAKCVGRVHIDIALTINDRRHRDASNYVKALEDLLVAHGVLTDDSSRYVKAVTARWTDAGQPQAVVTLIPA